MSISEDEYMECLQEAQKKGLKLCPEGYCTAKAKFAVYPSAYANGYAAQVCKGTKPNLLGEYVDSYGDQEKPEGSDLERWYKEEWVNVCETDDEGNYLPCGRQSAKLDSQDYPYCRPLKKLPGTKVKSVGELTKLNLKKICQKKRSVEQGVEGKPTRVTLK